jgi:ATP-dependent Clp protease adaptor protein ClpS
VRRRDSREDRVSEEKRPGRGGTKDSNETVLEREAITKKPPMYRVLLHNDDYTTMEFVVYVLQFVFRKSDTASTHLMLTIHHKGQGVGGVFTRDIAETKTQEVLTLAEEHGMPLLCTMEPDD